MRLITCVYQKDRSYPVHILSFDVIVPPYVVKKVLDQLKPTKFRTGEKWVVDDKVTFIEWTLENEESKIDAMYLVLEERFEAVIGALDFLAWHKWYLCRHPGFPSIKSFTSLAHSLSKLR